MLADNSVTAAKIAAGTIVDSDIANDAVTTIKILDANVTTAKIADANVTTAKILDANVTTAKMASSVPLGTKNKIINGNLGINQRAVTGSVVLGAGVYGHDRWKAGAAGCSYTFATTANVTTITISAGSLLQVIEGLNLQSGTHTLSWTGTATAKIGGGSYSASGVTGTATGGTNMTIDFSTGTMSLVQLELGAVATPFEHRMYGQELALCQRYAFKLGTDNAYTPYGTGQNYSTTNGAMVAHYPVPMRASPTLTPTFPIRVLSAATSSVVSAMSLGQSGVLSSYIDYTSTGLVSGHGSYLTSNGSTVANLLFTAEL